MASWLPAASAKAAAAASASKTTTSTSCLPFGKHHCRHSRVSFHLSSKPKLRFSTKVQRYTWNHSRVVKAQSNEVVDGSSNAAETPATKSEGPASEEKNVKPVKEPSHAALATEESLSEFINQVSDLVKLVDSRDIVELRMKQLDCELIIRKKEALPQPPSPAPMVMMHPSSPPPAMPSAFPVAPPAAAAHTPAPAPSTLTPPPSPPPDKAAKSSLPPLKCPMAGTFYRSPASSEPPFVKVGDKVQKGQVLCIIEAMKLMNEIEADQSGTIVDILAEDGKPVSVDTPLFVIQP